MRSTLRRALWLALLAGAGGCLAQGPVSARVPATVAPAPAASAPSATASAPKGSDAVAHLTVIEDKTVRIEETRLRGQAQRITVQSKLGPTPPYEILVGPIGRDPTKEHGAAGQSAWSLFDF